MTKYSVVLIPFPFDDLSANKVRPAVCLTNPVGPHRHIILAFITSRIEKRPLPTDFIIAADAVGFNVTGLRVSSTLRLHRLMTVTSSLVLRKLGELPPWMQIEVEKRLQHLFFSASV